MSEVFDVLYGSNVGCQESDDIFDIASSLLRFEQKFANWQHGLPATLPLISKEELGRPPTDFTFTRLRVVLTIRFLNFCILTHRPLLCKFLETIGKAEVDVQQLTMLRQVGANSVRKCAQSAVLLVNITQWAIEHSQSSRQLLGAWWFSLYFSGLSKRGNTVQKLIWQQHSTLPLLYTRYWLYSMKHNVTIRLFL